MRRKDMRRSDWHRILEKKYIDRDFFHDGIRGKQSLLRILKVTNPLMISNAAGTVLIADENHSWLQIALEEQYVWVTVMYDADGRFVQAYFDITNGNSFDDPSNPTFEDMCLDVVLTADNRIIVLDQEELLQALQEKHISNAEYDDTIAHCGVLCEYLRNESSAFLHYCSAAYKELSDLL